MRGTKKVEVLGRLKGESAYETAVRNGYKGSEAEWLRSLQGRDYVLTDEDKKEIAAMVDTEGEIVRMLETFGLITIARGSGDTIYTDKSEAILLVSTACG